MSEENNTENRNQDWQQETLTKLVFASLNEQRRTRRWNNFFKALFAGYLFLLLFMMLFPGGTGKRITTGPHTALVEVEGVISANSDANADSIITGLREAFEDKNTKGVIVRINSPGGSPVQAGYINDEIKRLRKKYPDKKLYAVVTDLCASGGYYIAAAADKIYVDKASVVGSIGVIMNGFGFVDAMKKVGVERRLYTAGENKGFLDPFSPQNPKEVEHVQQLLGKIHQQFIDTVKAGRGDRLKENNKIFSGLVWTGEESIQLGLADEIGTSSSVARDVIKAESIVDFTPKPNYWKRFADRLGTAMAGKLGQIMQLDSRSIQ